MTAINTTEVCLAGISIWRWPSLSFTYRESLRDIEACLESMSGKLYHMGFRSRIARSTLADANETHDWRIFADFAQHLVGVARPLHVEDPMGVDLDHSLYALDSTTIDLCLSLFPWAKFRQHKGAVKMHTLLDLHGNIPTFIRITDGIVRKRMSLDSSLYQILQILSLTLFEKTPILQALQASDSQENFLDPGNQLILFDF